MVKPLTEFKVQECLQYLNIEQKDFLNQMVKQQKKEIWNELLLTFDSQKKEMLKKENIEPDFLLTEILDGGYKKKPYRCECGKRLRFQYVVYQKSSQKTYYLGETCFENYISFPDELWKNILSGFKRVELERDELLMAAKENRKFDYTKYLKGIEIPELWQQQIKLGFSLTERQLRFVIRKQKEK